MSFILVNNFNTTLSAASSSTATTFTVSSSANLPTLAAGEVLPITLNDAATRQVFEICYVTSISSNVLTVERAQEGTSAQNWNVGDFIWNGPTAGTALLQNTVDDFTTSGLITAGGGIAVPSGQTITIPNATANNEPVALGQFASLYPSVFAANVGSATSLSLTTKSFTAPSNGTLLIFASMGSNGADWFGNSGSISVSAGQSLAQAFAGFDYGAVGNGNVQLTSGQSCTVTYTTGTVSTAAGIEINIQLIFVPTT